MNSKYFRFLKHLIKEWMLGDWINEWKRKISKDPSKKDGDQKTTKSIVSNSLAGHFNRQRKSENENLNQKWN